MLFTSYSFLFLFLPLLLLVWRLAAAGAPSFLHLVLLLFSAVFYVLWGPAFFLLLAALVAVNYAFGLALAQPGERSGRPSRRGLLALALCVNIAPLIWFKYSGFLAQVLMQVSGWEFSFTPPPLPVGISFYTFIQIAWLVGIYRRQIAPEGPLRHALFASCFPYVMSGPIVRYEQIGPQFDALGRATSRQMGMGVALFVMGMAKKVLLADSLAPYANAVFNAAERGFPLSGAEAWAGSFCYTFQLYFDFSGYTDMALGIGLMLGMTLPENFNSPYKSTGIVDFWRRWHISLGAWLRDFLYIPLGGSRAGRLRQYRNLFLTMLIGGAWHGAGWTFILWGALHGFMLTVNHWFRALVKGSAGEMFMNSAPMRFLCATLTFFCINWCWVIFRAQTLDGARRVFEAMFGLPDAVGAVDGGPLVGAAGMARIMPNGYVAGWEPVALLLIGAFVVWCLPNCRQLMQDCREEGAGDSRLPLSFGFVGMRGLLWALFLAVLAGLSLLMLSRKAVFLYFQF